MNKLKKNGWYDVDVLDLNILCIVMEERVKRSDIIKKLNISKEKARSRLERLYNRELIFKDEICRYCEKPISECECGSYAKEIYYYRESTKKEIKEMREFISMVEHISDSFDIKS